MQPSLHLLTYFLTMTPDEAFMHRCLQLARQGAGYVAPNPMVGAVLVYGDRIIGEGFHEQYGGAHAEVNCINSVTAADQHLISQSTIYVSLEPCAHFGKTPPCADLIIAHKIPRAVIGTRDPFKAVDGKGIEKLQAAGVEVICGVLEPECRELNKRFLTFYTQKRPYIILKWAQSNDGKIAASNDKRTFITDEYSNRLVHKWRSEEAAVMVGTNTAAADNPSLTTRLWKGNNPVRIILDMDLRLPETLQLFDGSVKTVAFNALKNEEHQKLLFCKLEKDSNILKQVCKALYEMNLQSVIIEGGTKLLQSFIEEELFDEIRVLENTTKHIEEGLAAPQLPGLILKEQFTLMGDEVRIFTK
ncbi:MAG: bifunctional diaminohydroxyphosphoribosylaminopyrimidine deaminase/5-amino-6-(5-phosphoribosylamino)uracil reductase RibD [Bacteroidota bacterium]